MPSLSEFYQFFSDTFFHFLSRRHALIDCLIDSRQTIVWFGLFVSTFALLWRPLSSVRAVLGLFVLFYLLCLFFFFFLEAILVLFLTNYLFKLLHLHFGFLYRFQIFATSFDCFIKLAHLEFAQSFVVVKPSVSADKPGALVASLSHLYKLTENFVGFVKLTMLEVTCPKIELCFVVERYFASFCLLM